MRKYPARILVFGAGAIGQWIGSRMALAGEEVTLVTRPEQCQAIEKRGVVLKEGGRTHTIKNLRAASDVKEVARKQAPFDWIFVTVKAYDVEGAMRSLGPLLDRHVRLLMFQNGIGTEDFAVKAVGASRTFICSVTKALHHPEAGIVEEANKISGVGLAPYASDSSLQDLVKLFEHSGIPHVVHADCQDVKWSKLLLNMLGNATCAILDLPTAAVFGHRGVFGLESRAFREAVKVMQAMNLSFVKLPGYGVPLLKTMMTSVPQPILQPLLKERMARGRGDKVPSLRLDMQKSPPRSEVQYLNGAVARFGEIHGVRTPANEFIARTLQEIVDGKLPWETYQKKPDEFVKDFRAHLAASRKAAAATK